MRKHHLFFPILREETRCWYVLLAAWSMLLVLPTYATQHEAAEPAATESDDPLEVFPLLGLDEDYFARLTDGRPLSDEESETLWRVMYHLRRYPMLKQEQWAKTDKEIATLFGKPGDFRGHFFRLRGRVLKVEACRPPEDVEERFELAGYYRCRLELATGRIAEVYTEKVPQAWREGAEPNAEGGFLGVFLKLLPPEKTPADASEQSSGFRPLFVATRLAWYSDDVLGRLGMDRGLLDEITDHQPILPAEKEAFYQLLNAVGRVQSGQLFRLAEAELLKLPKAWRWTDAEGKKRYSVVPLFNQPDTQRGRLAAFSGTARRIIKVAIDDPEIVNRFGFDHYYQVSVVTDDSRGNSLTFCLRDLPSGMRYGNLPHYGESVRVAGFFFKSWSYRVPRLSDDEPGPAGAKTRWQLSPLLIGRSLEWFPAPKPEESNMSDLIVGGLFVAIMLIIWAVAWRSNRRRSRAKTLMR